MNIGFNDTDDDEHISLDISKVKNKFYLNFPTYHNENDGHCHETGDGLAIRVDLLKNLVNRLSDITTVLPREMIKEGDPELAISA